MKITYRLSSLLFGLTVLLVTVSCKKLVEVGPPVTNITSASVYRSDGTAIGAITNMYVSGGLPGLNLNTSISCGLAADELSIFGPANQSQFGVYYQNALASRDNGQSSYFWNNLYPQFIYPANSAIEGLNASTALTPAVKQQLLGEAAFIRAYSYFYLVNLYGDVPLVLSTDYKKNALLFRAKKELVYAQIVADLTDAQQKLSKNYLDGTLLASSVERVRPSYWAATALLARVYLFLGNLTGDLAQFKNAETQAGILIDNTSLFNLSTLDNTFLKASLSNNEAIWQIQPVLVGVNTSESVTFILPASGPLVGATVLSNILEKTFEAGDQRKSHWTDSLTANGETFYYAYKYKVRDYDPAVTSTGAMTEYEMVLRLAEQYLIRAEAEARQGETGAAITDLNKIRNRAGLPNYNGPTDQASLLKGILHERQVELFTESGHRWLDLKRTGTIDAVMNQVAPLKGGTWASYKALFPVPFTEITRDINLTQNTGY